VVERAEPLALVVALGARNADVRSFDVLDESDVRGMREDGIAPREKDQEESGNEDPDDSHVCSTPGVAHEVNLPDRTARVNGRRGAGAAFSHSRVCAKFRERTGPP
jgi:hypothetical protein